MKTKIKFLYHLTSFASLLLLFFLVLPGCEKKSTSQKAPEKQKPASIKPAGTGPEGMNLREKKLAMIPEDHENIKFVSFSADGTQVYYKAVKQGKSFVVANDKTGNYYETIQDRIVYSLDGKKVAYDGRRGAKEYLVIDDTEVASFDDIGPGAFSPDGNLLAGEVQDKKNNKWFVVVFDGGKEVYRSQAYPETFRRPLFSPDGRILVFELGEKGKKRIVFFLDLSARKIIKQRVYDDQGIAGKFSFGSDYSRLVYEAAKEGKSFLVFQDFALNQEKMISLSHMQAGTVQLSPNGKKIVYSATKEGKQFLVVSSWESPAQGNEKGPYEVFIPPVFVGGPDLTTVAYQAFKEGKWRTVVGDKENVVIYDAVNAMVFSPDGLKIAYPAMKKGKWFMVVSSADKSDSVREGPVYDMVVTPAFSPDGKYIAYRARTGTMANAKRFIVIADAETGKVIKEGRVNDEVWPPVWSTDGKAAAYGARLGREFWWRVEAVE